MKRVNCLYRVSSRQQLYEDDIPIQRAECARYLATHPDWRFGKEYVEKAVSGFKTSVKDRDVLQEILEDARSGSFEVLLVYMADRIGRKEDESPVFVTTLNNLGVEVWTVKEGQLKTTEHVDKLLNYIRFWQAEGESRKTGMRVKDAQETMVRAGKFVGGRAPFGYRLEYSGKISSHGRVLKHLVVDEDKAPVVRKIFDYAAARDYGAMKIAKTLNEEGVLAPNNIWKAAAVAQILRNPLYMGYLAYNRRQRSSSGSYEHLPMEKWVLSDERQEELAIVPEETWHRVQALRETRKCKGKGSIAGKNSVEKSGGQAISASRGALAFTGLAYCGYCGGRLTNGSRYDYWVTKDGEKHKKITGRYSCANRVNGSGLCSGKAFYRAEEIESALYSAVASYLNSWEKDDVCAELCKQKEMRIRQIKRERDAIAGKIQAIQKDLETLRESIPQALRGEGVFSAEELTRLMGKKEKELEKAGKRLEEMGLKCERARLEESHGKAMEGGTGGIISNWGELFMGCSLSERKVMLAKLVERVDIQEGRAKIRFRVRG